MIEQIINFVKAWVRGDEAKLDLEFFVSWPDIAVTVTLIILGIFLWK